MPSSLPELTAELIKECKGISAQGYCTTRNERKELDSDLLQDIEAVYEEKIKSIIARSCASAIEATRLNPLLYRDAPEQHKKALNFLSQS